MRRPLMMAVAIGLCLWGRAGAAEKTTHKETYLKKAESEVSEWTAKLKSLEERSEKSGAQSRQALDRQLKTVDEKLSQARQKLDALRASNEGNWKSFRHGLDETLREVKRDYRKALSFFNKAEPKEKS